MKQLSLGLIAAAALAGCASNPEAPSAATPAAPAAAPAPASTTAAAPTPALANAKMAKTAMEESARLPAPSVALSAYGKFELKPMVMSDAVQREAGKVQAAQQLDATVRARLEPLLAEWGNGRGGKTLVIQPRVESIRIIGGANRFFAGALAGDSHIDMDLELKDAATGAVIAKPRVTRSSNAMAGGWSIGATDRNLPNYMAEIWRQYLSDNYKKQ